MRNRFPILVGAILLVLACSFLFLSASRVAPSGEQGLTFDSQSGAPQAKKKSDEDVRKEIQEHLANEPQLKGLTITVRVDWRRVVLGGQVHTTSQKNIALQIARTHADGREVIDDFRIIPRAGLR